jgi:hypothetical protein
VSCCAQGLVLLSPSIDVPRTIVLQVMAALQGIILPFVPRLRIVPPPTLEMVSEDPKMVSTPHLHIFQNQ